MLELSIKNKQDFLSLFYQPEIENLELNKKTKLNLFVLRIDSGSFAYDQMNTTLGNAAITYALSRSKIKDFGDRNHELVKTVQEAFRDSDDKSGEGGELFLYCFLETHLNAPKILSKMELKTAGNDYVKGSDGIHLLKLDNNEFHLIFGESKMVADSNQPGSSFRKSIAEAFNSIKKIREGGIRKEIKLIDSNLMKETYEGKELDFLKKILKPSARDNEIIKSNAFGIFVGFEIDITNWEVGNMSTEEFEAKVKSGVKDLVTNKIEYIKQQIDEHNLAGFHFYIYAVPFIKNGDHGIKKTRKEIIDYIK